MCWHRCSKRICIFDERARLICPIALSLGYFRSQKPRGRSSVLIHATTPSDAYPASCKRAGYSSRCRCTCSPDAQQAPDVGYSPARQPRHPAVWRLSSSARDAYSVHHGRCPPRNKGNVTFLKRLAVGRLRQIGVKYLTALPVFRQQLFAAGARQWLHRQARHVGVFIMSGRKLGLIVVAVAAAAALLGSGTAEARGFGHGYGHGYHGHGYGYGHRHFGVGVFVGPGWGPGWGGGWGYPDYPGYYPPPAVVAVPTQPPQYIEQGADGNPIVAPAAPGLGGGYGGPAGGAGGAPVAGNNENPNQFWYHCTRPEGYYPYVKTCPGAWEQVPAHPPAGS